MKIVFVHQNFPGQFARIAPILVAEGHDVVGLGTVKTSKVPGVRYYSYTPVSGPDGTAFQNRFNPVITHLQRAYGVAHRARALAKEGFEPDLVVVNTGWGENLFLKDIWPKARHIAYFEYYYSAHGQDVDFDPEYPVSSEEVIWRLRVKNAMQLAAFDAADSAVAPTFYQRNTFPAYLRDRIEVIHDGIDTQALQPNPNVMIQMGENGPRFDRSIPIVTYVTRNIEPMRGSHIVFRSLKGLLALHPNLQVIVIGGAGVSYGAKPAAGSWLEIFKKQAGEGVDWSRVHLVGQLPYPQFVRVLQASSAHLYLTYPFVLSWSSIESMALECRMVASDTPPVREIIQDGVNGRLFDFFDTQALVARVGEGLAEPEKAAAMAREARRIAVERYDFKTVCLPQWRRFLGIQ